MARHDWSRKELILAFNLYCKIPFGRIHIRNPQVLELAKVLGRTPSAVSWKLANFARLDPSLQKRNIKGATHGAHAEIEIWKEFNNNWEGLAYESERSLEQALGRAANFAVNLQQLPEGRTRETLIRVRVNQEFFRLAVLASYNSRCCVTGLSIPQLLTASHIVPWSIDVKNRTNPRNGLCLNAIHDRAFDCGLLTVTPELKVKISPTLKKNLAELGARDFLWRYDHALISRPERFAPDPEFLRYHNEKIFINS